MITRGSFTVIQCKNITRTHNSTPVTIYVFVFLCRKKYVIVFFFALPSVFLIQVGRN